MLLDNAEVRFVACQDGRRGSERSTQPLLIEPPLLILPAQKVAW